MVARLGRREGELARGAAALGDDAVVVVEDFLGRGRGLVVAWGGGLERWWAEHTSTEM